MKKKSHMKALGKTEFEIIRLIRSKDFQKVTINVFDGKISSYSREETFKPEPEVKNGTSGSYM